MQLSLISGPQRVITNEQLIFELFPCQKSKLKEIPVTNTQKEYPQKFPEKIMDIRIARGYIA
jgi:hypothetical protein